MKTLADWQFEVWSVAADHGWHENSSSPPRDRLVNHMLIVSEIAEATESVRKGEDSVWFGPGGKPEGEAIELADAVIRVMDYCQDVGIDLEEAIRLKNEYNKTRPYRHGNKAA